MKDIYIWHKVTRLIRRHLVSMSWRVFFTLIVLYMAVAWCMLRLAGEQQLVNNSVDFVYWMLVTISTVGYGDLSPVTTLGKLIVAVFVIPCGLCVFATVIGKISSSLVMKWRWSVMGLGQVNFDQHIVIIGWKGTHTLRLLALLEEEQRFIAKPRPIVLCVQDNIEHPKQDSLLTFIKVASYNNDTDMDRVAIAQANCIIIDGMADDMTMTTALYCNNKNKTAHIIAAFDDNTLGLLLKQHCPRVEIMPNVATEMVVKATVDPGSSLFYEELMDVEKGMTQYSVEYPKNQPPILTSQLFLALKQHYQATFVAFKLHKKEPIHVNPKLDDSIEPGSLIFYIADDRLGHIDWNLMQRPLSIIDQKP